MGCTVSKELESPISSSSSERRDAFLSNKDLAVHMERRLQSTERRFIAILSSTYGNLRKAGLLKAIARRELLSIGRRDSGEDNLSKVSQARGKDAPGQDLSSFGNSKREESRMLGEPEMINTRELMEGLEDDDASSTSSSTADDFALGLSSLSISTDDHVDLPTSPSDLPISLSSISPSKDLVAASTPPPHFRSIRSFQDVEAAMAARRCSPVALEKKIASETNNQMSRLCDRFVDPTASDTDTMIPRAKLVQAAVTSNDQWSAWNPDILHNALARKSAFEHCSSEEYPCFSGRAGSSFCSPGSAIGSTRVSLEFLRRLSDSPDPPSSRSSSESSTARNSKLSFQDWLLESCAAKQSDVFQSTVRRSLFKDFVDSLPPPRQGPRHQSGQAAPFAVNPQRHQHASTTKRNGESIDQQPVTATRSSSGEPREVTSRRDEKCELRPVFDAEFLESFERAMEQLTEDQEWYAGRSRKQDDDDDERASAIDFVSRANPMNTVQTGSITSCNPTEGIMRGDCKASICHCRGGKFLICPKCQGRRLVLLGDQSSSCCLCSGTGLIKCSTCSSS